MKIFTCGGPGFRFLPQGWPPRSSGDGVGSTCPHLRQVGSIIVFFLFGIRGGGHTVYRALNCISVRLTLLLRLCLFLLLLLLLLYFSGSDLESSLSTLDFPMILITKKVRCLKSTMIMSTNSFLKVLGGNRFGRISAKCPPGAPKGCTSCATESFQ